MLTVYTEDEYDTMVDHCANSSAYALTGPSSVKTVRRLQIWKTSLRRNFCINDKPTGALCGRQPVRRRPSGTNDKAGIVWTPDPLDEPR